MLYFLITRRDPDRLAARGMDVPRMMDLIRAVGLAVVLVTVALAQPRPGLAWGPGFAIAIAIAVTAIGWVGWMFAGQVPRLQVTALIETAAAGGALTALSPASAAVAVSCMVTFSAGAHLRADVSAGITAETMAAFLAIALATGVRTGYLFGYTVAIAGLWTLGLTRRAYLLRAEQAEQVVTETRRAREAENTAAALAERTRIAREIHDVLAHSLAAVSVNLQAAEGLLGAGTLPADNPELSKATACIARAANLTRDGLEAARRAVLALRDDPAPLPERLASLASQYQAAGDLTVNFRVTGQPRPIPEEPQLAAYRTAQEALTNARKHSPGQQVSVCLHFEPAQISVSVINPLPPDGAAGQLAGTGAGYGLAGLAERAALAGGALEAGPDGQNWQVLLRIPA